MSNYNRPFEIGTISSVDSNGEYTIQLADGLIPGVTTGGTDKYMQGDCVTVVRPSQDRNIYQILCHSGYKA